MFADPCLLNSCQSVKSGKINTKIERKDLETFIAIWQNNFMSVESINLENSNHLSFYFGCLFLYLFIVITVKNNWFLKDWGLCVYVCVCLHGCAEAPSYRVLWEALLYLASVMSALSCIISPLAFVFQHF